MARLPDPNPDLLAKLKRMEERIAALEGRSAFHGTGVHPNGQQGLDSDNYVHGESGFSLRGGDGYLEVNDIELRGGIIGNDALTNPVRGDVTRAAASNFSLTTAWKTLATATWDIPDGFDHVQASGIAKAFAVNGTAALDYLYVRSRIVRLSDSGELLGIDTPVAVSQSGGSGTGYSLGVGVLNFYPGDQVRLEVQARTAFAGWAANAANVAEWAGSLTWYRA